MGDIFTPQSLINLGPYVRGMLLQWTHFDDELNNLLRLSMPYIKHNRLAFFSFEKADTYTLQNLIRLQLATCLGLYAESCKKPLWNVRVWLVAMFMRVLGCGSPMDMHIFCAAHAPLLRLALLEYYIFFVETYMPVESQLQHYFFGTDIPYETTIRQIRCILDAFRQTQFQCDASIAWDQVTVRAQTAVEKCNRCARGCALKMPVSLSHVVSRDTIIRAMHTSPVDTIYDISLPTLDMRRVFKSVQSYPMPFHASLQQIRRIRDEMRLNTTQTTNMTFMHVCLKCLQTVPDHSLRCGVDCVVICSMCADSDCMIKISMVGKMIRLLHNYYYLCPFCMRIHKWGCSGSEFKWCDTKAPVKTTKRSCFVCTSAVSINTMPVLNSHIGVIHSVQLCSRHTPYEFQLKYVYDIDSLMFCIQNKFKKRSVNY